MRSVPTLRPFIANGFLLLMQYRGDIYSEKVWVMEVRALGEKQYQYEELESALTRDERGDLELP